MTNRPWTILRNIFKAKERFSYPDDPNISTFLVIKWAVIPYNWDISRGTTYNQVPPSSFAITSMGSCDYINFITKQNYAWHYSELTLRVFWSSLHVSALQFSSLYPQHISRNHHQNYENRPVGGFKYSSNVNPVLKWWSLMIHIGLDIYIYIIWGAMMGMGGWTTHQLTYHRGLGEFWLGRRW